MLKRNFNPALFDLPCLGGIERQDVELKQNDLRCRGRDAGRSLNNKKAVL